jgi:hypothetical protein
MKCGEEQSSLLREAIEESEGKSQMHKLMWSMLLRCPMEY